MCFACGLIVDNNEGERMMVDLYPAKLYGTMIGGDYTPNKSIAFHAYINHVEVECSITGKLFEPIYNINLCDKCFGLHIKEYMS